MAAVLVVVEAAESTGSGYVAWVFVFGFELCFLFFAFELCGGGRMG